MGSIEGHHVAAIFGVTGLVGKELARMMTSSSEPEASQWKKVYGIARRPDPSVGGSSSSSAKFQFIQCDLQNRKEVREKLSQRLEHVTHVFWVTWANQACPEQNKAMLSNALDAVVPRATALKHFSLQTGLKHYVSLVAPFSDGTYDEDSPRVVSSAGNFYYDLEDLVKERLREAGQVTWSIHRPGLLLGNSSKAHYNFVGSLAVYGTLCRILGLPFVFGGTKKCWDEFFLDGSDARLVAAQHVWAATDEAATSSPQEGQAFNAVNGPAYTWWEIWPALATEFGAREAVFSEEFRYSEAMAGMSGVWEEIVESEGLVRTKIEDLTNWEFMDVLFRCPMKLLGRREKADRLGFTVRYNTLDSILYWSRSMRNDNLIP